MNAEKQAARLLILADDLTGAGDCAARCSTAGLPARILLEPPTGRLSAGVTAFTTDTRHLSPSEAAQRVREAVRRHAGSPNVRWYKKIDSTLRGNIGAELDAMLDAMADAGTVTCAVVCPAFPAQGRGLVDGRLVYEDIDAHGPHLPSLLKSQSVHQSGWIALDKVREGTVALAHAMIELRENGVQHISVDAVTDSDLAVIYAAALPGALLCGSAGLVELLAQDMAGQIGVNSQRSPPGAGTTPHILSDKGRPVVIAVGSGSDMAHRQIARLSNQSGVCTHVIQQRRSPRQAGILCRPASSDVGIALYHLPPPDPNAELEGPQARTMAAALADEVACAVLEIDAAVLIVSGGDTSMHVLRRLGILSLDVCGEVEPGMPCANGVDNHGRMRTVVLKAGNHGTPDTLVGIVQRLHVQGIPAWRGDGSENKE